MSLIETKEYTHVEESLLVEKDELLSYIQNNETDKFVEKVKLLLDEYHINTIITSNVQSNESNVGNTNQVDWDMLQWACFHGNERIVKAILQISIRKSTNHSKNNNSSITTTTTATTTKREYFTPMHIASQKNFLNICWLLLGACLEPPQILDEVVVGQQADESIKHILDTAVDVVVASISKFLNERDQWGNTTLHTCAANGHDRLVQWHLNIGANHTLENKFNLIPLDVASNENCRVLLRNHSTKVKEGNDQRITRTDTRKMLSTYFDYASKLNDLISSSLADVSKRFDLNQLHQLIDVSTSFGLTKEIIHQASNRLEWLKARREILLHIDEVKSTLPIDTVTKYEYVNELDDVVQTVVQKEGQFGLIPQELLNIIQDARLLCDRSNAEYNLKKACSQCQRILCANTSHENLIEILMKSITTAKDLHANEDLIENGVNTLTRMKSELALTAAKDALPSPKLPPVAGMTTKQLKSYWGEEDTGHVKETEGYPLPPPGDEGYIWLKSEALQSLENALSTLEKCLSEAECSNGNTDLIQLATTTLKEKRDVDLKLLLEKDSNDRLAAVTVVEKAAKKLMKKKKGSKNKAK